MDCAYLRFFIKLIFAQFSCSYNLSLINLKLEESVKLGWIAPKNMTDFKGDRFMQEKFFKLPKKVQTILLALFWFVTIGGFASVYIIKSYHSITWLEVVLTCVSMFMCVLSICVTSLFVFGNDNAKND